MNARLRHGSVAPSTTPSSAWRGWQWPTTESSTCCTSSAPTATHGTTSASRRASSSASRNIALGAVARWSPRQLPTGSTFQLAAIWEGDRHDERRLHRQKNTRARLCLLCVASEPVAGGAMVDLVDELLLSMLGGIAQPATLTALLAELCRRGKRIGSVHGGLELLALRGRVSKTWRSARSPGRSSHRPLEDEGPKPAAEERIRARSLAGAGRRRQLRAA